MSGIESVPLSMYQSDFQQYNIKPRQTKIPPKLSHHFKPIERSKFRPAQMDLEILQPFKSDVNVPFNLLHQNKCILQTNPHDPIPKVKLEDKLFDTKLEFRRQRPAAVYMTPQISLNKIPHDIMYGKYENEGLIASIYSSDWKKACEVVVQNSQSKLKDDPMKTNFVKKDLIEKSVEKTRFKPENVQIPPMEIGLEKYIPAWEKEYPVEFVDTTKLFWEKNKEIGLCSLCDSQHSVKGLSNEEKTELDTCLKEDALRTPFTLHPPGYTGYVPHLAPGIQFRKKKFTKYDPFVTTLMTLQGAYDKCSI